MPLGPRQVRFIEEYLVDLNATQAAIRAGYSQRTASEQGARLLTNVSVATEIARLKSERSARTKLKSDDVLHEIDTLAASDIGQLFDLSADALRMLPMREWPDAARRTVASIKVKVYPIDKPEIDDADLKDLERMSENLTNPLLKRFVQLMRDVRWDQYQIVEIKLWDKNSALDKAGKHRGLFSEQKGGLSPEEIRDKNAQLIDALTAALPAELAARVIGIIRPIWVTAA